MPALILLSTANTCGVHSQHVNQQLSSLLHPDQLRLEEPNEGPCDASTLAMSYACCWSS